MYVCIYVHLSGIHINNDNNDKCRKMQNASQRTTQHKQFNTNTCVSTCVCISTTKGNANRARKKSATELRNSGSRPNDNCFLAKATEIHTYIVCISVCLNTYVHIHTQTK